eukprot:14057-Heterococcus_DN1.PRE.1
MAGVLDLAATLVQARIRGYLCRKMFGASTQTVGSSPFASTPTAPTADPATDAPPEYELRVSTQHSNADSLSHTEVHSVHSTDVKNFLRRRLHKRRHSAPSATMPPTAAAAVQQRPKHRPQLWRNPADVLTLCRAAARSITPAVLLLREGELATVLDALGLQLRTEPAVDQSDRSMPPSIELPLRCAAGAGAAAAAAESMAEAVAVACAATGLLQVCLPSQQITTAHGAAVRSALIALIEGPQGAGGPAEFITANTGDAAAAATVSDWTAAQAWSFLLTLGVSPEALPPMHSLSGSMLLQEALLLSTLCNTNSSSSSNSSSSGSSEILSRIAPSLLRARATFHLTVLALFAVASHSGRAPQRCAASLQRQLLQHGLTALLTTAVPAPAVAAATAHSNSNSSNSSCYDSVNSVHYGDRLSAQCSSATVAPGLRVTVCDATVLAAVLESTARIYGTTSTTSTATAAATTAGDSHSDGVDTGGVPDCVMAAAGQQAVLCAPVDCASGYAT